MDEQQYRLNKSVDITSAITRRSVLAGAAAGTTLLAVGLAGKANAAPDAKSVPRRALPFDDGWLFYRGSLEGADSIGFDDSRWRSLELPHDYSIEDVPGGSDDGGATADPADAVPVSQLTGPDPAAPRKIGPFDLDNTPGGAETSPGGGKHVGYTTNGEGWYRKHFTVDGRSAGDRVEVQFDGAYCYTDVWINGQHLGFVANGYVPFNFDLTPFLNGGSNVIAVRVRNVGKTSRWYSGSGIFRHTRLVITKAVRVPRWGVVVTTPNVSAAAADVAVKVAVENYLGRAKNVVVRTTVIAPDGRSLAAVSTPGQLIDQNGTFESRHRLAQPTLWTMDAPRLHSLQAEILVDGKVVDMVTEQFGVRSISFGGDGFYLNGQSVKMRGGNIHHDHGPLGAVTLYRSEERRVELLKAAGYNALRIAHNCPSPDLLAICDRLGILVYDEFTDMWDEAKNDNDYHQYFLKHWREDLERWVRQGQNHPSLIIRSVGNEIGASGPPIPTPFTQTPEQRAATGRMLADAVRQLDPTRPVCQGGGHGILTPTTNPTDYLDVVDTHYIHDYTLLHQQNPTKAALQSESFPATLYEDWKLVTDNSFVVGDFTWAAWDYIGESGIGAPLAYPMGTEPPIDSADVAPAMAMAIGAARYPYYSSRCADLDLIGQRRSINLYRNVVWGNSGLELTVERPSDPAFETHAFGWSWYDELESWSWPAFPAQPLRVRAYTGGDQVYLYLNGLPVGHQSLTEKDKNIASFLVPYAPGSLVAVAYRGGLEIGRKELRTVGVPAALRLVADRPQVSTSRDDLSHVGVEVVDAAGRLVPDAVVKVDFRISGGTLMGVGNGNAHNVDSFQRPRRWTYQGKALAVVRPPRTAGTITVSASAEGLQGATTSISVLDRPYPSS